MIAPVKSTTDNRTEVDCHAEIDFDRLRCQLVARCLLFSQNSHDAEDVASNILVKILQRLASGNWPNPTSKRIAQLAVFMVRWETAGFYHRKENGASNSGKKRYWKPTGRPQVALPDTELLELADEIKLIQEAAKRVLTARMQAIFALQMSGMTTSEMAASLGITRASVRSSEMNSRNRIREELAKHRDLTYR